MAFEKVTVLDRSRIEPVGRAIPDDARVSYWTARDGWRIRRFDWLSPAGRGRLLFQTGRGDFFEKYIETFAHFHARGWSVTAFDWRGQGGSGRLSANPHVGHVDHFTIFDDDLAAFWADWLAEGDTRSGSGTGPSVILGHSMGGMMAMRALAAGTIRPDAAILVAPMLGLKSPISAPFAGRVARWMAGRGDPARAAWRTNERPGSIDSRQALLTHDSDRYADEGWWLAQHPELRLGPPSWRWLAEGFTGAAALAVDPRVDSVAVPVLMLLADADKLVDSRAAIRLAARLPDVELVRFGRESAHEILREADAVRDRALSAIDSFLNARAPRR